ncbi:MAG: hypothetical protein ACI4E3_10735 [Candidatus Fimousia sp.]
MSDDELTAEFGENGWKQLPDAISRCGYLSPNEYEEMYTTELKRMELDA